MGGRTKAAQELHEKLAGRDWPTTIPQFAIHFRVLGNDARNVAYSIGLRNLAGLDDNLRLLKAVLERRALPIRALADVFGKATTLGTLMELLDEM